MHLKHGGYYYVFKNKWKFLSRDYGDALRLYSALIAPKRTGGIPDVIDRALSRKVLADNTKKAYGLAGEKLKIAFAEFTPADFRPADFYQWITGAKITDNMAQLYRSVMIAAMQLAVEEGLIDANPMKEVRNWKGKTRDRYLTDAEYLSVRDNANKPLRAIITISLQTGQRIGDVLKIKYSDLTEHGLYVEQEKTHAKMLIAWTPDLKEAVAVAKATHTSVKGMTLFAGKKGKPIPYSTVRGWWLKATKAAGVENGKMHDIRAKTGTDARKQGLDSKSLLGHKTDQAHERYQRNKEIPVVQPLPMVKP
jgi:integrase